MWLLWRISCGSLETGWEGKIGMSDFKKPSKSASSDTEQLPDFMIKADNASDVIERYLSETKPKAGPSEVKRYSVDIDGCEYEYGGGEYVYYYEYQALQSKLDLMTDRFNGMCDSYKSAIEKCAELEGRYYDYAKLEHQFKQVADALRYRDSKIASLTAEVEELKEDIDFLEREKAGEDV